MRNTIVCIVGPSGSGKTLMSKYLWTQYSIPYIVSCTTRPMREGEKDGVDHFFVSPEVIRKAERDNNILAYTKFGGYEYCALKETPYQHRACTYVIDEDGVRYLMEHFQDEFELLAVYVDATEETRWFQRCIPQARIDRDKERVPLERKVYSDVIHNDGTKREFFKQIDKFVESFKFWLK